MGEERIEHAAGRHSLLPAGSARLEEVIYSSATQFLDGHTIRGHPSVQLAHQHQVGYDGVSRVPKVLKFLPVVRSERRQRTTALYPRIHVIVSSRRDAVSRSEETSAHRDYADLVDPFTSERAHQTGGSPSCHTQVGIIAGSA
jgi:hypothetical protein